MQKQMSAQRIIVLKRKATTTEVNNTITKMKGLFYCYTFESLSPKWNESLATLLYGLKGMKAWIYRRSKSKEIFCINFNFGELEK